MKKVITLSLVLVMTLAICLTAVGCNPTEDGEESGVYNLKVWCAELDRSMIDEMLYQYEKENPDNIYNWTVQEVGEDVAGQRVISDPSTAADVFSFASDQLGVLVNNNAILAVPAQYQSSIAEDQIAVAEMAAKFNNQYYAYPYTYENVFLYYNNEVLSESQVGSLESIGSANTGVEYNIGMDMDDAYYTSIFLFTAGMQLFGADGQDVTNVDFANDNALKGCEYIYNLSSKAKFNSILEEDQATALKNGNVAAIISGPHMVDQFKTALGAKYAVTKLPTIELDGKATQMISFSGVKLYGVNRNTKYAEESAKLAMFLSNYDNQYIRLTDREFCPTNSQLYNEAANSGVDAVEVVIEQAQYTRLKPAFTQMSSYWTPMATFLAGVFKKTQAESAWLGQLEAIEKAVLG